MNLIFVPQWVGKSCGQHGPYTFYKSFKYKPDVKWKMLSLGDFFFVRCSQNEPLCIAELQLLWETKNSEGVKLSSSRLYFLPECTPEGRMEWHGEDEVLAVRDKVVLKIDDLTDWIVSDVDWSHGGPTIWRGVLHPTEGKTTSDKAVCTKGRGTEFDEDDKDKSQVTILSYNRYCRHKAMLKRLESTGQQWWSCPEVRSMGLVLVPHKGTKMLFCREEFEHPSLADNEQLCDHLAPKLKGRPRKKRSSTMEDGVEVKKGSKATVKKEKELQPLRRTRRKRTKLGLQRKKAESKEEAEFLEKLYKFMQDRSTPIERLPCLGFKQINLFHFFKTTEDYGGYDNITSQRLWKKVYIELGGNPGCTSAATCTRRHYERYIQPYANHVNNNETGKTSKPKLKKRKKTKGKEIQNESKQEEKMPRPRKKVKKVREHLEELKQLKKLREEQQQNGLHLVTDLSTVQPSSLPGHTVDANFNIERTKGMLNSLAVSMLHENQLLHPNDLRHKLNSKHQVRAKGLIRKVEMEPENGNDLTLHNRESPSERTPEKSSSPSMASRPSVIQHTQQSQENLPGKGDRRSPYHQAVQPSDLILRKLAQEMQNNSESIKAAKTASDLQLNKFPRPFVFPSGVPFIRPFVPYHMMMRANMPLMSFQHDLPAAQGSGSVRYPSGSSPDKVTHSKPKKAHQVPVIQPSSLIASGAAEQDEPCDLSLPKKRKPEIKKEFQHFNKHEISAMASMDAQLNGFNKPRPLPSHMVEQHNINMQPSQAAIRRVKSSVRIPSTRPGEEHLRTREVHSPAKRVKMTPQPRGSITQGVINSERPSSSREPKVKRERSSTPDTSGSPDMKGMYPFMYPGFMATTRGITPFPFMPGLFRPGFPAMVQTPTGFFPQTPLLPPHSPLLGSTVPTSLAMGHETMLPRGVIMPSPLAFASPIYRTPVPPVVPDKQPAS
ncbi:uncharacterized protein [Apostichopus japonicus]|uniref:uncharacterized protein isoform X3 n=1 Tax=Stichopus japonicus TaxID=307972 RepID=UPI003AB8F641